MDEVGGVKKAQAAMEFLMTYGWIILVIIAAIGALSYYDIIPINSFQNDQLCEELGYEYEKAGYNGVTSRTDELIRCCRLGKQVFLGEEYIREQCKVIEINKTG